MITKIKTKIKTNCREGVSHILSPDRFFKIRLYFPDQCSCVMMRHYKNKDRKSGLWWNKTGNESRGLKEDRVSIAVYKVKWKTIPGWYWETNIAILGSILLSERGALRKKCTWNDQEIRGSFHETI